MISLLGVNIPAAGTLDKPFLGTDSFGLAQATYSYIILHVTGTEKLLTARCQPIEYA